MARVAWWLGMGVLLAGGPITAHDMWLQPSDFVASVGEVMGVGLWLGHAGEAEGFPRRGDHLARFDAIVGDRRWALPGQPGLAPAGYLKPSIPGLHAVVYESTGAVSALSAERFDAYLVEEGLESIRAWRRQHGEADQPGRERYRRSLKSLVQVGAPDPDARDRVVGLPLELVIESPLHAGMLRARLLWRGTGLADARVALHSLGGLVPDAPTRSIEARAARTDADGWVTWPSVGSGRWMLAAVHMERARSSDADHDWQSTFTTLTFALGDPSGTGR